jgi:Putative beta-lactamase-inhibitor-like, PepSY-like
MKLRIGRNVLIENNGIRLSISHNILSAIFQFFYRILSTFIQNDVLFLIKKYIAMKTKLLITIAIAVSAVNVKAQEIKAKDVPENVKSTFAKKYPQATKISWEKEKGNFEANWGGKSGEDNSVQYTPTGEFVEIVKAISVSALPKNIASYVKSHYKGAKIKEAGLVTDAKGTTMYEAEIKGGDLIFDKDGNFIKKD